ncbi:TolB family protein [Spirosoma montaniterrae]|uniref:Transporter n=1 Tax=Spirosoma montaniterrae TaxID=1178516 RepID=A0A1P9WTH6_9BACT|nr:TolB family protein [Spirosoma montaniterrae]AQG78679.1 transporter [Spirosoma montaniterrae]
MKYLPLLLLTAQLAIAQTVVKPVISRLEIYDLTTNTRRVVRQDSVRFEAPNWTRDGQFLIINERGLLYKVAVKDGQKARINTGTANACNNDHGLTPDGKTLIISHNTDGTGRDYKTSNIFTVPLTGGEPTRITQQGPSYWHGVSPDGKTLAYVAERPVGPDNKPDFDIYTIPITGGTETRLTTSPGLDDGPDYSPDGRYIYFNSYRTGHMQLWRMAPDGSNPEQLTNDQYSNWFPHPSPDGRWIVFISYLEDQKAAHPADKAVMLRLMDTKKPGVFNELARFQGGQGTINVPSWSPDSKAFGFVTY